jgi:hypothetical protein
MVAGHTIASDSDKYKDCLLPCMSNTLFPSILPGVDFVDDSYTKEELEKMDWQEIRSIAAEVDSKEIDGQSDREDMEDFLEGKERV